MKNVGVVLLAVGVLVLTYGFFNMYMLVGRCPSGAQNCVAYSDWELGLVFGAVFTVAGILLIVRAGKK